MKKIQLKFVSGYGLYLSPYEDEEVWGVNEQTKMIYTAQGQRSEIGDSYSSYMPSNNTYINETILQGRRDTRRKYYDNLSQYSFPFGIYIIERDVN